MDGIFETSIAFSGDIAIQFLIVYGGALKCLDNTTQLRRGYLWYVPAFYSVVRGAQRRHHGIWMYTRCVISPMTVYRVHAELRRAQHMYNHIVRAMPVEVKDERARLVNVCGLSALWGLCTVSRPSCPSVG